MGSGKKKTGKERMGENEEICLFENERIYPMTPKLNFSKSRLEKVPVF